MEPDGVDKVKGGQSVESFKVTAGTAGHMLPRWRYCDGRGRET